MRWRHAEAAEPHPAQPDLAHLEETGEQVLASCMTCGQVLMLVNP